MSFKAEVKASLGWNWNDGAVDNNRLDFAVALPGGNGEGQAEAVWHVEDQTLLDATSIIFDLTELSRTVFGDTVTVTFLTVKALLIVNRSTDGGELVVGNAPADWWSEPFGADGDRVIVPPDSPLLLANRQEGWDVDNASRNLQLAAIGGDVTYSMAIVGTTTAPGSGSGSGSGA
ncbi:MAG: hypothetical protein A2V70_19915 [Planctomycetes bacterium RBG_13_63_9]|nr:MAG: hypothetical protein A2V70_19915 [Planctomycetes bacterium RBG_13_63_9]